MSIDIATGDSKEVRIYTDGESSISKIEEVPIANITDSTHNADTTKREYLFLAKAGYF